MSVQLITRQLLLWAKPRVASPEYIGGKPIIIPYNDEQPKYLWTLYSQTDRHNKPKLPYTPEHHRNAFLESRIHDYEIKNGNLHYYSRVSDGGVWLLLEFC